MTDSTRPWRLEGFPASAVPLSGAVAPDEVQKAYTAWLYACEVNPRRGAHRLQPDDLRYSAKIPGAKCANDQGDWQLMCDYDVIEGNWATGEPGCAVFKGMGYAPDNNIE